MGEPWAKDDPSCFICLGFRDPQWVPIGQAVVHRELQEFLSVNRRALVELPRDHGKTFQVCCRIVWELGRNPSLRVKVVCATDAVAKERARFIREAIERNPWVPTFFPHLTPGEPWAEGEFTVARPAGVIGPSVAAFGIGAGSTGTRADLLVCDDIVDVRSLHSKAERDRVADYFENNLMNLLEPDGRFWGLFTPWHRDDVNARLIRGGAYAHFRRAVGDDLKPVWPQKWSRERLAGRKAEVGAASFARGYRLVPVAEEDTPIRPDWVRVWTEPARYDRVILSVDPAIAANPKADASALVVLGRVADLSPGPSPERGGETDLSPFPKREGGRGVRSDQGRGVRSDRGRGVMSSPEIHVLEATARRVTAPALIELIDECDRRWNPDVILFESNAAFAAVRDILVQHAAFGPRVKGVTQSKDKASRVAALSVPVQNGRVRLQGDGAGGVDAAQRELFDQMTTFPFAEHDDLLDAAATGTAYLLDRREPRVLLL